MALKEDGDLLASSPSFHLEKLAAELGGLKVDSDEFAEAMDKRDPLREFRSKFQYPKIKDLPVADSLLLESVEGEADCIYFAGNSLGLKPKSADAAMKEHLDNWGKIALFMHFSGPMGAAVCDQPGKAFTAELVGAKLETEVAILNGLSVNLHLLMAAFYKPEGKRNKILIEDHAFPSDRYAMASVARRFGFDPNEVVIKLKPRDGEHNLRPNDILEYIKENGKEIAIVLLPGIQYYTGQKFDIESITRAGHAQGCLVGFDLAHAVGNVCLKLHDWNVDFACWCSYKYLNSGAGGIAGIFLHEKHFEQQKLLHGWWSNKQETRFEMAEELDVAEGADGFRLSNPPPWLACLNMASLEIFHEAGMDRITQKQYLLTGYLELLLSLHFGAAGKDEKGVAVEVITPADPEQRGSQLSLSFSIDAREMHADIERLGVVCDFRAPNVMRVAPVPLYNTFAEVRRFIALLKRLTNTGQKK